MAGGFSRFQRSLSASLDLRVIHWSSIRPPRSNGSIAVGLHSVCFTSLYSFNPSLAANLLNLDPGMADRVCPCLASSVHLSSYQLIYPIRFSPRFCQCWLCLYIYLPPTRHAFASLRHRCRPWHVRSQPATRRTNIFKAYTYNVVKRVKTARRSPWPVPCLPNP
jgi:hypothetical protein